MGNVVHDTENGAGAYDNAREICAVLWDDGTRSCKVNMKPLRTAGAFHVPHSDSLNQSCNKNSFLHNTIKAAKLVQEDMVQNSIVLDAQGLRNEAPDHGRVCIFFFSMVGLNSTCRWL